MKDDGQIRLTWGQIAWFISVLTAVLLTYSDLRVRLERLAADQSGMAQRVERLERVAHTHDSREP